MSQKTSVRRRPRRSPTHPGEILREDVLPALNLERADESPFRKVQDLILTVVAVEPAMVLMNTKDGAGPAVGAAIDGSDWWTSSPARPPVPARSCWSPRIRASGIR